MICIQGVIYYCMGRKGGETLKYGVNWNVFWMKNTKYWNNVYSKEQNDIFIKHSMIKKGMVFLI